MVYYKVTVNGNAYEVGVEEISGGPEVRTVQSVPPTSVAASASTAAAAGQPAAPKAAPATDIPAAPKVASLPDVPAAEVLNVMAPLPGTVISIGVSVGDKVKANQLLLIFEAMKMENELVAPRDGTITRIYVAKGDILESGKPVVGIA